MRGKLWLSTVPAKNLHRCFFFPSLLMSGLQLYCRFVDLLICFLPRIGSLENTSQSFSFCVKWRSFDTVIQTRLRLRDDLSRPIRRDIARSQRFGGGNGKGSCIKGISPFLPITPRLASRDPGAAATPISRDLHFNRIPTSLGPETSLFFSSVVERVGTRQLEWYSCRLYSGDCATLPRTVLADNVHRFCLFLINLFIDDGIIQFFRQQVLLKPRWFVVLLLTSYFLTCTLKFFVRSPSE